MFHLLQVATAHFVGCIETGAAGYANNLKLALQRQPDDSFMFYPSYW